MHCCRLLEVVLQELQAKHNLGPEHAENNTSSPCKISLQVRLHRAKASKSAGTIFKLTQCNSSSDLESSNTSIQLGSTNKASLQNTSLQKHVYSSCAAQMMSMYASLQGLLRRSDAIKQLRPFRRQLKFLHRCTKPTKQTHKRHSKRPYIR